MTHPQVSGKTFTPIRRFSAWKTHPFWPHIPNMTQYGSAPRGALPWTHWEPSSAPKPQLNFASNINYFPTALIRLVFMSWQETLTDNSYNRNSVDIWAASSSWIDFFCKNMASSSFCYDKISPLGPPKIVVMLYNLINNYLRTRYPV